MEFQIGSYKDDVGAFVLEKEQFLVVENRWWSAIMVDRELS